VESHAGLTCAARTCEGKQAYVIAGEQLLDFCQLPFSAYEWSRLGGKVVRAAFEGEERRKIGRQAGSHYLIDSLRVNEVPEAVLTHVQHGHTWGKGIPDKPCCNLGEEGLPTMSRGEEAGDAIEGWAGVVSVLHLRRAYM
jgi:hypothetical protein